jgi:Universal stress protein UspA and related nucleotide-binding proteins
VGGIQVAAKELEEAGQSILNSAVKAAEERSVVPTAILDFSVGNAGMRIVQLAKEKSADMIVIGARGQSRIRALLMGSVANSVVNNAPWGSSRVDLQACKLGTGRRFTTS